MNALTIEMLGKGKLTYKEAVIYDMLKNRKYTSKELSDILNSEYSNMRKSILVLKEAGLLEYNKYTKQYWAG